RWLRNVPSPSWNWTHLAKSRALALTEPAGFGVSISYQGMTSIWPWRLRRCGLAWSGALRAGAVVQLAEVIPSGSKIRFWTKSAQLLFDAVPTAWPAAVNMMVWYWKAER